MRVKHHPAWGKTILFQAQQKYLPSKLYLDRELSANLSRKQMLSAQHSLL